MAIPNRNINYPTAIKYGAGRIKDLPKLCKDNGFKNPLVVTDPFLATQPMVADAVNALKAAGRSVSIRPIVCRSVQSKLLEKLRMGQGLKP